ncbi:MAG: hypothetical protein JNM62_13350 [Flavobacteriales bacterium]|nr:hypothetical protein [Flavobacteriales bacterium]
MPRWIKTLSIMMLVVLPGAISAQWYPIDSDSIDDVLATSLDDRSRLQAIDVIAGAWFMSDRALPYLEQGDVLTRRLMEHPDERLHEEAMRIRATLLYNRGYHAKFHREMLAAQRDFREAFELGSALGDTMRMATCLDALGVTYLALGLPQKALDLFIDEIYLLRSLSLPPRCDLARGLQHRARALLMQRRYAEASNSLSQCDTTEKSCHALTLMVAAEIEEAQGDHPAALGLMLRARELVRSDRPHWDALTVLEPLSSFLLRSGRLEAAALAAHECAGIASHIRDDAAWCGCRAIEGEALAGIGHPTAAREALQQALDTAARWGYVGLARETGDEGSMVHAARLLADLYKREGNTEKALGMTERWADWKDSVQRMEARDAILRHDLRIAEFTDSIADAERTEQATIETSTALQHERGRGRILLLFVVITALLTGSLAWYFAQRRIRERVTARFELQRVQHEHMIRELRMRDQVSHDLHEDLGAGLSALKLWSDMAAEGETDPWKRKQLLQRSTMADDLIANLRQIIWTLNSSATRLDQLVTYITDYTLLYCAQHELTPIIEDNGHWPELQLTTGQRRETFLIMKEALQNVAVHANASTLRLNLAWQMGLLLVLHDDGTGIPDGPTATTGNGIRSMQRRAASLGAKLSIDGSSGTRVTLFVPLANESSNPGNSDRTTLAV